MPRRCGGRSLRSYFAALLVTPLLAGAAATGVLVEHQAGVASTAHEASRAVATVLALEELRTAVSGEIAPAAGRAALEQRAVHRRFGLSDAQAAAVPRSTLDALSRRADDHTNDALWALSGEGTSPVDVADLGARVSAARQAMVRDVDAGYASYTGLVGDLDSLVLQHLSRSRGLGLDADAQAALDDLGRLSEVSSSFDAASRLYLEQLTVPTLHPAFVAAWGRYESGSQALRSGLHEPALADPWARADSTLASQHVEDVLAAAALEATSPAVGDFTVMAMGGSERRWYAVQAVTRAAHVVTSAADRQAARAEARLRWTLAVVAAIGAVTGVTTVVVHRRIDRPLRLVSRQAERLLGGVLDDVPEDGPREVRAVARGLTAAVDGLRRVRAQADAIAAGDLDDAAAQQPVAGPLGELLQTSVGQLVAAFAARRELQEHLEHQAAHDALTGLPNRARTLHVVGAALGEAVACGGRVAVFFVDLDRFKAVNDGFGHAAGDQVLQVVGRRMQDALRAHDTVGRLGGDEFVVVVRAAEELDLQQLADRLIATISRPISLRGEPSCPPVQVGASIGIAVSSPASVVDAAGLLHRADVAVYEAKRCGRGVVRTWDPEMDGRAVPSRAPQPLPS